MPQQIQAHKAKTRSPIFLLLSSREASKKIHRPQMILPTTAENIYCGVTLAKVCLQVMSLFKSGFFPRWSFQAVSQNLCYNFLLFAGCKAKKMGILVQAHIAKALYSEASSAEIVVKLVVTTGPGSSRHQVLLKSPVSMTGKLEKH